MHDIDGFYRNTIMKLLITIIISFFLTGGFVQGRMLLRAQVRNALYTTGKSFDYSTYCLGSLLSYQLLLQYIEVPVEHSL